ncbi:MAG: hypothetical protein M3275_03460 [Thermoproteota archaeon]|nr:hypothetical protein [Thermoproteota archaeon]
MHLRKREEPAVVAELSYSSREVTGRTTNYQKVTESVTLRFDKNSLKKLRNEADEKQISLNTLMNQIVTQHLEWHANAAKAGFTTMRKGTVVKMLEKISEQDIISIAELVAKKESKGFIMMLRNEYSLTSALEVLETWIKIAGYSYRHNVRGDSEHSYIIYHDMSRKWSLYLKELFRFIFEDFGLARVDFDIGEDTLAFKVDLAIPFWGSRKNLGGQRG